MALLDSFLRPIVEPEPPYAPAADVLLYARVEGEHAVAEVYVRPSGTIGFRCTAWVAWRDAGHVVRGHSWWKSEPPESGIAASIEPAREMAEGFARSRGISLGQWRPPPNKSPDQTADRIQWSG